MRRRLALRTRLITAPPTVSDYPPNYRFPLPPLPAVRLVRWEFPATSRLGEQFLATFWWDLTGAFDSEWASDVRGSPLELRLDLGRPEWVNQACAGLENRARGYGVRHVEWHESGPAERRAQLRGIDVCIRSTCRG